MTLVVAALTRKFVVLAADRRLTLNGVPIEDNANKLVVLDDSFVVGYTGQAEIAGERTHLWLAERLKEHGAKSDLMESRAAFAEKREPQFKGWDNPEDRYRRPTLDSLR